MNRRFSTEFNYDIWGANTKLTFTTVPWDSQGNNVINFKTQANLDAWLDSRENKFNMVNVNKDMVKGYIDVNMLYTDAVHYNYLRATNGKQSAIEGDRTTSFYYFILGVEYISTHTTRLILQLDVWHTYLEDFAFGMCFVQQGHLGIAASNAFDGYGRVHLTIPEGLDTGAAMRTVATQTDKIITKTFDPNLGQEFLNCGILVASTIRLGGDIGTADNPKVPTAVGSKVQNMPSGVEYYLFRSLPDFIDFMEEFSDKPWASNGIVSITVIPNLDRYIPGHSYVELPNIHAWLPPANSIPPRTAKLGVNWRNYVRMALPEKFRHLSKFLTFPYSMIELTGFNGQAIPIRPEQWNNPDGDYAEMISILPPGQRISVYPVGYNASAVTNTVDPYGDDGADFMDAAINITNFPSMAMVNNGAVGALASNAHSISYGYESINMASERARRGAETAYSQATAANQLASDLNDVANKGIQDRRNLEGTQQSINASMEGFKSIAGLDITGALIGNTQSSIAQAFAQGAATQAINQNNEVAALTGANADYVRDSNKALADYYIQADAATSIAALNAKVRDMQSIPPSMVGQTGGEMFNVANGLFGVSFRIKMIDAGTIERIGNYWCRYGYALAHWRKLGTPADLAVMSKFSYWKVQEVNMTASRILEAHKNVIRGQMSRGVTIWESPDDIGQIALTDNAPKAGVTL